MSSSILRLFLLHRFFLALSGSLSCHKHETIHCEVTSRHSSVPLPPPAVALIQCETHLPGLLRVIQRDELSGLINYTSWNAEREPCLFRLTRTGNCAHIFIRIDSPPDQQNISICRVAEDSTVCTCIDLSGELLSIQIHAVVDSFSLTYYGNIMKVSMSLN